MTITLYYRYLMHDIDQWTFRLANVRVEDAMLKNDAQSNDKRATDLSFYRRKLEDGVAHLSIHLSEELVNSHIDTTDALDTTKASWVFTFKDDSNVTADSQACAELMHRFVLWHALRDWANAYAPDVSTIASQNLAEAQDALDEGLYSLELPTKNRNVTATTPIKKV